ncbi:MAG: DEAD/DEAH box helicase [Janthinobacterium lividum]
MPAIELRPYQTKTIEEINACFDGGISPIIVSIPTGGGKTVIAAELIHQWRAKGKRILFVADRIALIDQTSATLDHYGINHGVIQGGHWRARPWERVQVASAETLSRRGWPETDLVIIDECHSLRKTITDQLRANKTPCLGLSATPTTKGLGKFYKRVITVTTTNKLIAEQFLVPFKVFAPSEPDMTGVKAPAGEWSVTDAAEKSMPIIGDVVQEYIQHGEGKKFIAFGCTVAHCEEMKRQFEAAGVQCELYTYRDGETRTEAVKEFRKPHSYLRGLISISALSRGFDVSDVEVVIMARPLKNSLAEHLQILGRGLRIHTGKKICTVLDHSGNCVRFWNAMHDFLENGITELDDGRTKPKTKAKAKIKRPAKCPSCKFVHDPAPSCPACGQLYTRSSLIQHQGGRLTEVSGGKNEVTIEEKRDFHGQLLAIAAERGYASGWVSHKFKDKFGVWPNSMGTEPVTPTPAVMNWVRSRAIAYSKAKKSA